MTYQEQQAALALALKGWPETFGLRAFPGETFRIGVDQSYYSETYGVMLYTQVQRDGKWCDFAKGSPAELRANIVRR